MRVAARMKRRDSFAVPTRFEPSLGKTLLAAALLTLCRCSNGSASGSRLGSSGVGGSETAVAPQSGGGHAGGDGGSEAPAGSSGPDESGAGAAGDTLASGGGLEGHRLEAAGHRLEARVTGTPGQTKRAMGKVARSRAMEVPAAVPAKSRQHRSGASRRT